MRSSDIIRGNIKNITLNRKQPIYCLPRRTVKAYYSQRDFSGKVVDQISDDLGISLEQLFSTNTFLFIKNKNRLIDYGFVSAPKIISYRIHEFLALLRMALIVKGMKHIKQSFHPQRLSQVGLLTSSRGWEHCMSGKSSGSTKIIDQLCELTEMTPKNMMHPKMHAYPAEKTISAFSL